MVSSTAPELIENNASERTGSAGLAAVEAFRACGVDVIFGLMGSSTLDFYDALYDAKDIKYVGVRDERAGTHMADAYGRVSGKPGIMIAGQSGPGATNLVTGLGQAYMAYSPMLVIAGLPMSKHLGMDGFQEIDQNVLFGPVTKRVFNVPSGDRIAEFIQEGYRIANTGRRGPVVLNIARDLFAEQVPIKPLTFSKTVYTAGRLGDAEMAEAAALVKSSEKPVIVAGGGVKWGRAQESVLRLSQSLGIPVVASSGHGDVVPTDIDTFFGYAGAAPYGNPIARELVNTSDLVIALGSRLGFNTTLFGNTVVRKDARILQVDIDPDAVGKYYPAELGVAGDAGGFAAALAQVLSGWTVPGHEDRLAGLREKREQLWAEREEAARNTTVPMRPEPVFAALRRVMPRNTIYALDSGTLCRQAADLLHYFEAPALLTPLEFAEVGFGFPAGVGAQVAAPDRTVVSISGDGGFGFTMIDVTTAVQSNIPTIAIVMDNDCWGSERAYQRDFYNERFIGDTTVNPRFDEFAISSGADGCYVTEVSELEPAFNKALEAKGPYVIHIKIDADATVSSRKDALKHRVTSS